jgi:hypothetical protein
LTEKNRGHFFLNFRVQVAGDYKLDLQCDGRPIDGSPVLITVSLRALSIAQEATKEINWLPRFVTPAAFV